MNLLVLVVMVGAFYAILFVPQQRKMKAHQALLRSLEPGDVVVTSSGIHGAIADVDDGIVWLEVAPEIELKIAVGAISERIDDSDDESEDDNDDAADDELADSEDDA